MSLRKGAFCIPSPHLVLAGIFLQFQCLIRTLDSSATNAKDFSPRDLRRTWKTLTGHAGISKDDRDRLQNHSKGDISSVHYDRYDYLREKRAPMEKWDEWIIKRLEA